MRPWVRHAWRPSLSKVVALSTALLGVPAAALAQPAGLSDCVYPTDVPDRQAAAERIMTLALPFLDRQVIYYRDEQKMPTGAYAVRRSLRIYFYDKNGDLLGTALRQSQSRTSYFESTGRYLGQCIDRQLLRPDKRPVRFGPGAQ